MNFKVGLVVSVLVAPSFAHAAMTMNEAAFACNNEAYEILKQQRKRDGVRPLMSKTAAAKKHSGRAVNNHTPLEKCKAESFHPECKIESKLAAAKDKLAENEEALETNMETNILCSPTLVNRIKAMNPSDDIRSVVDKKINSILGPKR